MKGINPNDITALVRIAFGGTLVYSAVALWRALRARNKGDSEDSQTLDGLWARYERGDISWDEHEKLSRNPEK